MQTCPPLAAQAGTYVLWLRLDQPKSLLIGRLGRARLPAGHYAYVGSAFGPGGVRARLGHHLRGGDRRHWHIDYLRAACRVRGAWVSYDRRRLEHLWAAALLALPGARQPVPGFGASDCSCATHLVAFSRPPSLPAFQRRLSFPLPALERVKPVGG